jgi:hypothetical protein
LPAARFPDRPSGAVAILQIIYPDSMPVLTECVRTGHFREFMQDRSQRGITKPEPACHPLFSAVIQRTG